MRELVLANVCQHTKFEKCIFTVVELFDVKNIVTLKFRLQVTQSHSKASVSIRFPIRIPCNSGRITVSTQYTKVTSV